MEPIEKRVLILLRDWNSGALPALAVARLLAYEAPGEFQATVAELTSKGWLRQGAGASGLEITEEGRLAMAGPLELTLYTRPGCHLCEEAKAAMAPLLRQFSATLREVNIDDDPALCSRYNFDVPVVFLGARKVAKHRVDLEQLRRQLDEAARAS